jgi:hypothetical protein
MIFLDEGADLPSLEPTLPALPSRLVMPMALEPYEGPLEAPGVLGAYRSDLMDGPLK